MTGLSTAAASSRSATVAAWASVSRAPPATAGAQRSEYASWTFVALDDRTAREQRPDVGGGRRLTGMRAQLVQVCGEDRVGPEQALDAHRRRYVGDGHEVSQILERKQEHPEHPVRAVDERKALLLAQRHRLDCRVGERLRRGGQLAVRAAHGTLPHERERTVGERGEVTRAAERAVLGDDRRDAGGEHPRVGLRGLPPDAGTAAGQRGEPEEHEGSDHLALNLGPGACGMAADERPLEARAPLGRDVPQSERPEPGRDAVVRSLVVLEGVDHRAAAFDRVERAIVKDDRHVVASDRDDVGGRRRGDAEGHSGHGAAHGPIERQHRATVMRDVSRI
jgi:hypothetical protein